MRKESTCNAGNAGHMGSIPGLGRSPGGGHGIPLQCSCLENPMDRGAWQGTVNGVSKSQIRLSDLHYICKAHLLYPFVCRWPHFDCFFVLAVVNSA